MKFLSDRYTEVYTNKGINICALKVANPAEGDEMGYRIDSEILQNKVYNHPEEAIAAIDAILK